MSGKRKEPEQQTLIADETTTDDQPTFKAQKVSTTETAKPANVTKKQAKSKYIFYPDLYNQFDASRIVFGKDPLKMKDNSGDMIFMQYMFPDGTTQPLMVQSPNAMYSPTGITMWGDAKNSSSILLSAGKDWESNPLMVEFKTLLDKIKARCVDMIIERKWNGINNDKEIVTSYFTDILLAKNDPDKGIFPPAIKCSVAITGQNKTELYEKAPDDAPDPTAVNLIVPGDVTKGCGVTGIIHFPWIFRRKRDGHYSFTAHASLFQAKIFPGQSFGSIPMDACAVSDS